MTHGLQFAERACFLEPSRSLVVADLHIGLEATSAVTMPVGERQAILSRVDNLLDRFDAARLILAGDVLHAFETVPRGVTETLADLRARVDTADVTLEVLAGNHDTHLEGLGLDLEQSDSSHLGDTVVCHGHERPSVTARRYVIGHDHPTIEIEGHRHPCALVGPGPMEDTEVVVLPTLTPLARGTPVNDLREGDALSPLIDDPATFEPVVTLGTETHRFPPLGELRPHL